MFTGIVSEVGRIVARRRGPDGADLTIACRMARQGLGPGESVAVSGVCLTVTGGDAGAFSATASLETVRRTTLGRREVGDGVNLERALRPADRMGGHFVQGHVDGVGRVRAVRPLGVARVLAVEAPEVMRAHLVDRGSVALDGVSLTVTAAGGGGFEVTLIPATLEVTTLGALAAGAAVNLEADILSKYVARALESIARRDVTGPAEWLAAEGA